MFDIKQSITELYEMHGIPLGMYNLYGDHNFSIRPKILLKKKNYTSSWQIMLQLLL